MKIQSPAIGGAPGWVDEAARLTVQVCRLILLIGMLTVAASIASTAIIVVSNADPLRLHLPAELRP